ncbi:M23 family metallopeptidase [Streptomyces sp. NPDC051561]|uniref:M23 family metallopeptidase n=1 Tax=Streptomyces sp. NPDC051561 TaxID=3365658 RepID=UPI0037BD88C1
MRLIEITRGCAVSMAVCLAVGAVGTDAQADPAPEATEVARLYREAGAAVKAHEAARKAVGRARDEVARLQAAEAAEQARLARLRDAMGELARSQYRTGGGSVAYTVRFLTSPSPEQLMRRVSLAGRGSHATSSLMVRVQESRARLARDRAASAKVLTGLKAELVRQSGARRLIEQKLKEAQERLRLAEEARRLAAVARSARDSGRGWSASAGAPGPSCAMGAQELGGPSHANRAAAPRWVKPVDPAPMSAGFAESGSRWKHRHTGQDFAVPDGEPVRAVGAGVVEFTGCGDGFGNQIVLRHPNGYFTQYAHLSAFGVGRGRPVVAGDIIGLSGSTGNVSGPHLHFEVRITPQLGSGINPLPWLRERGVRL